ncbi:MAG: hypothetical protein IRY83_16865 [Chloroflexi bacterium]|nr:hypothetical protein [Chloroflexota bacterium]
MTTLDLDLAALSPDVLQLFSQVLRAAGEKPAADETGGGGLLDVLAELLEREAGLRTAGRTMGRSRLAAEALRRVIVETPTPGLRWAMAHILALRDAEAGAATFYREWGLEALAESRSAAAEFAQALLLALDDEKKSREEAFRRALERMAEADEEGTDDA